MNTKKKVEVAKRIAVIAYILENKTSLEDIEGDAKILEHLFDIADFVGGIEMLNTVKLYIEELRSKGGVDNGDN